MLSGVSRPHLDRVVLTRRAASALSRHARESADGRETGGILLGHMLGREVLVSRAEGPGPGAFRSANAFIRDLGQAQAAAVDAWERERAVWIGEWHTHPRSGLFPSDVDLGTYRRHLADPELGLSSFLAVIARGGASASIAAWSVTRKSVERVELVVG
jgi:integrative and conjugative element protein (TIGR02256 family)